MIANKPGANQPVKPGEIIVEQGEKTNNLILLQKGKADLYASFTNPHKNEKSAAAHMYSITAPAVIGCNSLVSDSAYSYTVKSSTDCVVSIYESSKEHLAKVFISNSNIAIILLKSIYNNMYYSMNKIGLAKEIQERLYKMNASLSLSYFTMVPSFFEEEEEENDEPDPIKDFAKDVKNQWDEQGSSLPTKINMGFLNGNHYTSDDDSLGPLWSEDDLIFIKEFVSLPNSVLAAIAKSKPYFLVMMAEKMTSLFDLIFQSLLDYYEKNREHMLIASEPDNGWIDRYEIQCGVANPSNMTDSTSGLYTIGDFLLNLFPKLHNQYSSLWKDTTVTIPQEKLASINRFIQEKPKENEASDSSSPEDTAKITNEGILDDLKDSARKIFLWSDTQDKYDDYQELIGKLKSFDNPMDSDTDVRRIRRQLNGIYWEVFKNGIRKHLQKNEPLSKHMQMFFEFGFLDETLLEENQMVFLYESSGDTYEPRHPVHNVVDWLRLIYEKKAPTSINELGLTYFEIVKQENRNAKWKRPKDLPPELDTPDIRLDYEIKSMIETNCRLTTGTPLNYFNILTKYQITQGIENALVSKKKLDEYVDKLLSVDFSAFHREVLYEKEEMGIQREFIQYQVIPNFIIVPSAGTNFQHWQEREGKDRYSPGRLISPALAMMDLYDMLLNAIGAYRWEMTKTIMGIDWNNVGKSSLTSDYIDYIQFYRKNRELTLEIKEKLTTHFKRFRDDRSKFIHDYKLWVKNESEGTQKLNKVARKIFSKHVLFAKDIREELLKQPNFTEFIQKSINIRRKKAFSLKPRYKKYQRENDELPEELKETYRFYNGDY